MATYPTHGALPQWAKYIGEFVPDYDSVHYFYRVVAYNRNRLPVTNTNDSTYPSAWGPIVLDGDHAISINWSPVIGASFFIVFKATNATPPSDIGNETHIWYIATASETEILDVGYPCATRNSFLNPGLSPIFPAGCCGDSDSVATNVPPIGMAPPDDGHQGGGFVRMQQQVFKGNGDKTKPGGENGELQFNDQGKFGGAKVYWDEEHQRLGIHKREPKYALDVDGEDDRGD